MRRRRARLALVLGCALPAAAGAQTFAGQVVDSASQRPLVGVLAGLVDPKRGMVRVTRTDDIGAFYLEAPREGRFHVVLLPSVGRPLVAPAEEVKRKAMVQHIYRLADTTVDRTIHHAGEVTDTAVLVQMATRRLPREAVENREAGWATFVLVVDADGQVEAGSIWLLGSSHPWFAELTRETTPGWRFTPARRDGTTVRQLRTFTADFGPEGDRARSDLMIRYGRARRR